MADVNEQIAQIKANSRTFMSTTARQVLGGYVVNGQTQYMDKSTGGVVLSENAEGVAHTAEDAAQMGLNFLRSGNFDGNMPAPAPAADTGQQNMFGNPATI